MAKYGKNNYFDGVVLPEPKEEALRRMAKGVNTTRGYLYERSIDIDKYNGDRSFQVAFTTGDDITTTQYIRTNCPLGLVISNDRMYVSMWGQWLLGYDVQSNTEYDVVVSFDVTTRASTLYVNGQLIATRLREDVAPNYSKTYFLGAYPEQTNLFTGDIALCREFNFQIPKAVVALLHNNGDPAGYIVPKSRRLQATPYIRLMAPMTTDGWSSYNAQSIPPTIVDGALAVTYPTETGQGYNNGIWRRLSVNVENECYFLLKFKAKADDDNTRIASFVGVGSGLPYYRHEVIASTSFTEYYAVFKNTRGVSMTSVGFYPIYNTSGNGKFYIKDVSVTSIGLIAEYLPQNLIPTAEGSVVKWLDSAPQLPEANGILPPLDASVGGYDLAAIGNPKIII